MKHRIVPFWFPNLGCPSRCTYCDQNATRGEAIAMPTPEQIKVAIEDAAREAGSRSLEAAYYGGTFTALPAGLQQELLEPVSALLKQGVLAGIRVSTHPSFTSAETMALLVEASVTTVELGIQSFSDRVLEHNGRDYDRAQALRACQLVRGAGLDLVVQLMPFLPQALEEDDLAAARLVAELAPEGVRLFPTVALAGTRLADWWRAGLWQPPSIEATTERVARMLRLIAPSRVPVLRIGLQTSLGLDRAVLAGPYHPALGELCRAALLADVVDSAMAELRLGKAQQPELVVETALASLLTGHDRFGLKLLNKRRAADSYAWKIGPANTPFGKSECPPFWRSEVLSVFLHGNIVRAERTPPLAGGK